MACKAEGVPGSLGCLPRPIVWQAREPGLMGSLACGPEEGVFILVGTFTGVVGRRQVGPQLVLKLGALYPALPCDENIPALVVEQGSVALVALSISRNLCNPVVAIAFWRPVSPCALVSVPKAPMHKHDLSQSREDEIRGPGQGFAVEAKPIPQAVRQPAYRHLWLSVLGFHRAHDGASVKLSLLGHHPRRRGQQFREEFDDT